MTNRVYHQTEVLSVLKASMVKNGGFAIGGVKGFCQEASDANNELTIQLNSGRNVFRSTVYGTTDDSSPSTSGSAVAFGDTLYVNMTTGLISKDSSGTVLLGYALGTRNARGAYDTTATIASSGSSASCDILLAA